MKIIENEIAISHRHLRLRHSCACVIMHDCTCLCSAFTYVIFASSHTLVLAWYCLPLPWGLLASGDPVFRVSKFMCKLCRGSRKQFLTGQAWNLIKVSRHRYDHVGVEFRTRQCSVTTVIAYVLLTPSCSMIDYLIVRLTPNYNRTITLISK